ncbi:hypothetical protein ANCCAN_10577 [Ancylostoma caninum]|uniref:Uncharacterized protein n=1 Tax=Ancylostoma caninum TaxID=29170 RepID=A0A368GGE8_ANCCA|nr:hypothetical protein ANCCAN_10577 [Ancylostoma caninum]
MLEHRKRARRKGRSSSDSTSISPCHAENCVGLITKYSAVLPSCIYNSGDVHNLNVKPTLGSSPPTLGSSPINHIVIDSDTDESNIDTECGDEDGDSGNGINTMRYNSGRCLWLVRTG